LEARLARRHLLQFEHKHEPPLSRRAFARRLGRSIGLAIGLAGLSLLGGMLGYHYLEAMDWIDAFLNASMILSGMGPTGTLQTWGGKLFAGLYALYSGLTVIVATSIILAPVVHRLLHKFHYESRESS
jgi:hypothetical protein